MATDYTCKKCGHHWQARTAHPRTCPKCRCRNWETYTAQSRAATLKHDAVLSSTALGGLLIVMSCSNTYGKNYAHYLGKAEQQVSKNLQQLQSAGLVTSHWRQRKKQWELNKEALNERSKAYAQQQIEEQRDREIAVLKNMKDFEKISTYREHNQLQTWIKETDVRTYRDATITQIQEKTAKDLRRIERLFSQHHFINFMHTYVYLAYPNIDVPFSSAIDFYTNWEVIPDELPAPDRARHQLASQ